MGTRLSREVGKLFEFQMFCDVSKKQKSFRGKMCKNIKSNVTVQIASLFAQV